jgi:hypothetical protein
MMFVSNGIPLKFKNLGSHFTKENLSQKSPLDYDASPSAREARLKMGLYSYSEISTYLKSISFKCMGFGSHIQEQCLNVKSSKSESKDKQEKKEGKENKRKLQMQGIDTTKMSHV